MNEDLNEDEKTEKKPLFQIPLNPNLDGFRSNSYKDDDEKSYIPPEEEVY